MNGPDVRNPDNYVRISKTGHVWQPDRSEKRRNPDVRFSDVYCSSFHIFLFQVCSYNEAVSKGGPKPDLFEIFSSLFPEDRDPEAALLWQIVCDVSTNVPSRGPDPVKIRTSRNTSKAIVANARLYLVNFILKFRGLI